MDPKRLQGDENTGNNVHPFNYLNQEWLGNYHTTWKKYNLKLLKIAPMILKNRIYCDGEEIFFFFWHKKIKFWWSFHAWSVGLKIYLSYEITEQYERVLFTIQESFQRTANFMASNSYMKFLTWGCFKSGSKSSRDAAKWCTGV